MLFCYPSVTKLYCLGHFLLIYISFSKKLCANIITVWKMWEILSFYQNSIIGFWEIISWDVYRYKRNLWKTVFYSQCIAAKNFTDIFSHKNTDTFSKAFLYEIPLHAENTIYIFLFPSNITRVASLCTQNNAHICHLHYINFTLSLQAVYLISTLNPYNVFCRLTQWQS